MPLIFVEASGNRCNVVRLDDFLPANKASADDEVGVALVAFLGLVLDILNRNLVATSQILSKGLIGCRELHERVEVNAITDGDGLNAGVVRKRRTNKRSRDIICDCAKLIGLRRGRGPVEIATRGTRIISVGDIANSYGAR